LWNPTIDEFAGYVANEGVGQNPESALAKLLQLIQDRVCDRCQSTVLF